MLNCAVVVVVQGEIALDCRIVVAPVASVPFRARSAEEVLLNKRLDNDLIEKAAAEAFEQANPRDSVFRGSWRYRKEMVKVIVRQGITRAVKRASAVSHSS